MNIEIAENLRAFRKERGNTQEDLSSHLGISIQAVSKWERGEGYPDITLLPYIAFYYGKTVDELLGCGEIQRNRRMEELTKQYRDYCHEGKMEEAIALMHRALREFPHNLSFMSNLAFSLWMVEKEEYLDECIGLCEKILDKSVDDGQRYGALKIIVYAYGRKKNIEKAKEYAGKLPGLSCAQNIVLVDVLKGEENVKIAQQNIITLINLIDASVLRMLHSGEYTPEEKIFAYETVDKLYKLFLYDGNYGMEHIALHLLWMYIAKEYAKCRDEEKTINALKTARMHAFETDHLKEGKYTSLFADRGSYSGECYYKDSEESAVDWMKKEMKTDVFGFIHETDAFREIMDK